MRNILPVDINGDGLDDLVVAPSFFDQYPLLPIEIWINQGDGRFANRTADHVDGAVPTTTFSTALLTADFNGDGRPDILIVQSGLEDKDCFNPGCDGSPNLLMLSQPNGKLKDVSATHLPDNLPRFNHVTTSLGDLNGDGRIDIAFPRLGNPLSPASGVVVLLNTGGGQFELAAPGVVPDEIRYAPYTAFGSKPADFDRQDAYGTAIADVDGDGKAELIVSSSGYGDRKGTRTIRFFSWGAAGGKLVEAGRFSIAPAIAPVQNIGFPGAQNPPPEHNGAGASHVTVADIDGDGLMDVVVNWETWTENHAQIMRGRGGYAFEDVTARALGGYKTNFSANNLNWTVLNQRLRDINGDGRVDLVLGTSGNANDLLVAGSPAAAWINDGTGIFNKQQLLLDGTRPTTADVAAKLGCSSCGYGTYYGRFVRRTDGVRTLDMLLIKADSYRSVPVSQEDVLGLYVFAAR